MMTAQKVTRSHMTTLLKTYKRDKARLKMITNELQYIGISLATINKEPVQESRKSDPTAKLAHERAVLKAEYDEIMYRVCKVENLMDALTAEQRRLLISRFVECNSPSQICFNEGLERHTYYYQMNKIYDVFATLL